MDFQEQTGISFPLREGNRTLAQFEFPVGVSYPYPRDVIVDQNLTIRAVRNSFDVEEIQGLLNEILAE